MVRKNKQRVSTAATNSTLTVDFCNIRGLHANINEVHYHLESSKPALFFLTETQILNPADISYLLYPGYTLEHTFRRHAGVCAFIRDDVCCRRLTDLEDPDLSTIWLRTDFGGCTRVYACLYRSHSGDLESTRLFEHIAIGADTVSERFKSAEIVVLGDCNAHHVEWLGSKSTNHTGRVAYDLALAHGFSQLITGHTRIPDVENQDPSLLDLFMTTHPDQYQVSVEAPLGRSDHCLIRTIVSNPHRAHRTSIGKRNVWHYQAADWDGFREFIAHYPWAQVCFSSNDVDVCADLVTDVIRQGMECFIPNSVIRVGGRNRPWFNKACADATSAKLDAYKSWTGALTRQDPDVKNVKKKLNAASRICKKVIAMARATHISKIGDQLARFPSGSRAFWSLAKAAEGNFCQPSLPSLRKQDNTLAHSAREKAELLSSFFASNSTIVVEDVTPPTIPRCTSSMPEVQFTQRTVRKELLALDVRKSSGPDGIPAIVLKQCAPELTPVLTRLFQLSYTNRCVPKSWKSAIVHPIPKKGDRADPTNYRPIAITSLLCKVMERVINTQLLGYLEEHQLISDRQYGFRHGRSAGDLLVYLTHRWAEAIESKGEALAVSLDIAKAFDRVWHKALLAKLPSYGLPEGLCAWVTSFLSDRSINVVIDGSCSDSKPINAGVPQGSVLSPTLFILHINDMLHNSNMHCYADDSTGDTRYTGRANSSASDVNESRNKLVAEIEATLQEASKWGELNLVQFNPIKTQACAFSTKKSSFAVAPRFQNIPLKVSESISILGVDISANVQFRGHIAGKVKLASKKLGVLNKAKRYFTSRQRLLLYKAQVRPHVEYCSHLWNGAPKYQLDPIDAIQRRATRIVDDPKLTVHLEPLGMRRDIGSLSVFYRIYNGECSDELHNLIPASRFYHRSNRQRSTAHPHIVDAWKSHTVRFSRSFLPHTGKLWNELPAEVFPSSYSMKKFKRAINRIFQGRQRIGITPGIADTHRRR